MKQKSQLIILFILIVNTLSAQRFIYDIDFLTFFDNRESHIPSYPSQTLFGARLAP